MSKNVEKITWELTPEEAQIIVDDVNNSDAILNEILQKGGKK